jgi:dTDP-4-dehydrorhamnose reductase
MLGSAFMRVAASRGWGVLGAGHQAAVTSSEAETARVDIRDAARVLELVREVRPSWIVHCAALTDVDWCEDHPDDALRVNADGVRNVATAAKAADAGIIYISTDSVFDGSRGGYLEDDRTRPINAYARSKLEGERALREVDPDRWIVARTTIYGWSPGNRKSIAEWFLSQLEASGSPAGFVDVVFTPILVQDLAHALIDLIGMGAGGVYHVAGSEACTKYEFGRQVALSFGFDPVAIRPVELATVALRARRPLNTSLSVAKVSRVLGRELPTVASGLAQFRKLRTDGEAALLKSMRR